MLSALAEAIRDDEPDVMRIFCDGFNSGDSWRRFIANAYGEPPELEEIIGRKTGWDDKLTCLRRFQTIFIACWIYHPLEKGTYMLSLDGVRSNVERGYRSLDARWSSHLSKQGRSAGEGFNFLNGYKELLVQIEGDFLFLKAEGHRASGGGAASSLKHIAGWVRKSITGKGNTASPDLKSLAENSPQLGIHRRSAENYGKKYQALLTKHLKLRGPSITVDRALDEIITQCLRSVGDASDFLSLLIENGYDKNLVSTEGLAHRDMGHLMKNVLLPFASQSSEARLRKLIYDAQHELDGIIQCLLGDLEVLDNRMPRYFQEVRTSPASVSNSLRELTLILRTGGDFPGREV